MICHFCHGYGKRLNPALTVTNQQYEARVENPQGLPILVICEECGGSGIIHCCEGLREQPRQHGD